MVVETSGFGAGDNELAAHPNLLHVVVGEAEPVPSEVLTVLETNVDDLTGEYAGHTVAQLMDAGALDAWVTPIWMKKQRPAFTLSVLVRPLDAERIGDVLLEESGSIGYRATGVDRSALDRSMETVQIDGHEVRVKHTRSSSKAEYDDVAAVAAALGRPARGIAIQAEGLATRPTFPH